MLARNPSSKNECNLPLWLLFFFFLFSLSSFFLGYYPNRKLEIAVRRVRLCSLSSLLSRVRVREDEAARE